MDTYSTPLHNYSQMIMGALEGLNEKEGSTREEITSYIESTYPDLPPTISTHVSHTLEKLKQTGQLMMLKEDTYAIKKSTNVMDMDMDPTNGLTESIKRGRGRPPKPKVPLPPGVTPPPARPRGRPPKDPLSPTGSKKSGSTGRPRGRPRKSPVLGGGGGGGSVGGVKRGRGRPKKN